MLLSDLLEGKLVNLPFHYGDRVFDIPAIENPTINQVSVLIDKTKENHSEGYVRGLMYRNTRLYIWDGWSATHDDAWNAIFPQEPNNSSDITTFHIEWGTIQRGIRYEKPGDYSLQGSRWEKILLKGLEQSVVYRENPVEIPKIY